jgi:type VI secretion system secreted protein VgrG
MPLWLGEPALAPVRLTGREGVDRLFEYELLLKTPEAPHEWRGLPAASGQAADIDLDAFLGREIACTIELDGRGRFEPGATGDAGDRLGAGRRHIGALVAEAGLWGEEGRHLQYRFVLRPWLWLATLNCDCRIFQNRSVVQILQTVLGRYGHPVELRLSGHYPPRDYQTQYNESDFAFFSRLCEEWGISYHFEHGPARSGAASHGKGKGKGKGEGEADAGAGAGADGPADPTDPGLDAATHRLVLTDAVGAYRPMPSAAYREVDYHAPGWKTDAEYLHSVVPRKRLVPARYTTGDYDYTRPRADLSASHGDDTAPSSSRDDDAGRMSGPGDVDGRVPGHDGAAGRPGRSVDTGDPANDANAPRDRAAMGEVYQWHAGGDGHGIGGNGASAASGLPASHYAQPRAGGDATAPNDPHDEGRRFALLRLQALRTAGHRARASGNLRGLAPGHTFALRHHPREDANAEYVVLESDLVVEDIDQASQIAGADPRRRQQWRVSVDLLLHPVDEPLRPAPRETRPHGFPKPHTHGPQTAMVVGPPGENLWTDDLGRIKVQFFWDREGGRNAHSSCWVRVASPWAGNQLGAIQLPRIGQEVVIDFIGGDPDLPLCTGRVHNQLNTPPWALPGQAALSGWRSRELAPDGGGNAAAGMSNHLVMDDTARQLQVQLASDHRSSSLGLGHLTRIEDHAGRKDARGEGFELRTDAHGVLRAAEGLLLTTRGRPRAAGHAKAMAETLRQLARSRDQHERLAESARMARAQETGDQDEVVEDLQGLDAGIAGIAGIAGTAQGVGSGTGIAGAGVGRSPSNGGSTSGNGSASGGPGAFPELAQPHLVLSSAAGIAATAAGSTHVASAGHNALTSGGHTSISAARSLLASAGEAIRLFAYRAGLRLIAAGGDIDLTALQKNIRLLAKLEITHTAERITIQAEKEVLINGGGSYSRWNAAGVTHGTRGSWTEHAAGHAMTGPDGLAVDVVQFPRAELALAASDQYPLSI